MCFSKSRGKSLKVATTHNTWFLFPETSHARNSPDGIHDSVGDNK